MDVIQIIIQAGAVGIAVYVLYVLKTLVGNHINHNTDALKDLTSTLSSLKQVIKDFHQHNGKK